MVYTAIIRVKAYNRPGDITISRSPGVEVDVIANCPFNVYEQNPHGIFGMPVKQTPIADEINNMIINNGQSNHLRQVKDTLENMLFSDKTEFAKTIARLIPKTVDFDEMRGLFNQTNGFFKSIANQFSVMEERIQLLADSNARLESRLEQLATNIESLGNYGDLDRTIKEFGTSMASFGIRNRLTEMAIPKFYEDNEKYVDRTSIQESMVHDFVNMDFGLSYLCITPHPPTGDVSLTLGPQSNSPGLPIGSIYRCIQTSERVDILCPVQNSYVRDYDVYSGPFGKLVAMLRVRLDGMYGYVEVLESYYPKTHERAILLRGHSVVLTTLIPDVALAGVQTVVIASSTNGVSLKNPNVSGHVALWMHPNILQLDERPDFHTVLNVLIRGADFTRPLEISDNGQNALDDLVQYGSSRQFVLERLPHHVSSGFRHNIREFFNDGGFGDVVRAFEQLGDRIGTYAATHLTVPTVEDLLSPTDDTLIRALMMFKSRAVTGIPKGEHTRLGSIKNRYHYSKAHNSTIMAMKFGENATAFVCPACGCGYVTTFERQLCNVLDYMFLSIVKFSDGLYPAMPGRVVAQNQRAIADHDTQVGRYGTKGVVMGQYIRVPLDHVSIYTRQMVVYTTGGTIL